MSGDAHAIMVDDGSNNGYHRGGRRQVARLSDLSRGRRSRAPPSTKGGPYSHGCVGDWNQYGLLSVSDLPASMPTTRCAGAACASSSPASSGMVAPTTMTIDDRHCQREPGGIARVTTRAIRRASKFGDLSCAGADDLTQVLAPYKSEIDRRHCHCLSGGGGHLDLLRRVALHCCTPQEKVNENQVKLSARITNFQFKSHCFVRMHCFDR
jgi:hypothetical protein